MGPRKNAAAYRTVLLLDAEGQTAMRDLKRFLSGNKASCNAVLFPNEDGRLETTPEPAQVSVLRGS
jgi:hypothetical protein